MLPMQMQRMCRKRIRFDLSSYLFIEFIAHFLSSSLFLCLSLSIFLLLLLSSKQLFFVSFSLAHTAVVTITEFVFVAAVRMQHEVSSAARRTKEFGHKPRHETRARPANAAAAAAMRVNCHKARTLITPLPAAARVNMQIARKIQFMNENAIYFPSVYVCVRVCVCGWLCVRVCIDYYARRVRFFCCMRQLLYQTILTTFIFFAAVNNYSLHYVCVRVCNLAISWQIVMLF